MRFSRRGFLSRLFTFAVVASLVVATPLSSVVFATPSVSVVARNAALAAITAKIDVGGAGTLVFYSGTKPATVDTALSGNTVLATLTFSTTSFGAPASGVSTANAITSGTAVASGTATFARAFAHDGTTAVIDFGVGTSGADINLSSTTISSGQTVSITSLTLTQP
jgi:hypothetical protein